VLALDPNGVGGRHDAILEDPGESSLRGRALADDQRLLVGDGAGIGGIAGWSDTGVRRAVYAEGIDDADAWEKRRAEGIDGGGSGLTSERLRRERLTDGAVNLLAKDAKDFGDA
jgi:hypothetical protein